MSTNGTPSQYRPAWELTLDEYLAQRREQFIRTIRQHTLPHLQTELSQLGPRATRRKQELGLDFAIWQNELEELEAGIPPRRAQQWQREYEAIVKRAIKQGKDVAGEVVARNAEFSQAQKARRRYEKGLQTSFANRSAALDTSMQAERGFKAKRQDGKAITPAQLAEIAAGLDEIEQVVGSLRDILLDVDVTIAHTNGKMPFLKSTAAGLYSPDERTISMGASDWRGQPIPLQAHEVAHCLDIEAGKAEGVSVRVWAGRKSYLSSSLAEWDDGQIGGNRLINLATRRINRSFEVHALFRRQSGLSDDEKGTRALLTFILSSYWRRPREVWARLFEQYISSKLQGQGQVAVWPDYTQMLGYWTAQDWAELEPLVEVEIKRRLDILRRRVAEKPRLAVAKN